MFSNQSAEISFDLPCKTLNAIRGDKEESRFVVGTSSLREPNYLYILRFHSQVNELGIDGKIAHDGGPVDVLCSSPHSKYLLWTSVEQSCTATLYQTPPSMMNMTEELSYDEDDNHYNGASGNDSAAAMDEMCTIESDAPIVDIVWKDSSQQQLESESPPASSSNSSNGDILTVDRDGILTQWDIDGSNVRKIRNVNIFGENNVNNESSTTRAIRGVDTVNRAAWDPHNEHAVGVTCGNFVKILDWRVNTSVPAGTVQSFVGHRYGVTDIDYNHNKPYVLSSCGQDGLIKFWDLRKASSAIGSNNNKQSTALPPLLVASGGHSHFVSRVKYNPFHDQLVLSGGTDSLVNLWRISTISSAPLLTLEDHDVHNPASDTSAPNVRVSRYEHNDSVYDVAWSTADAWVYLSVGYDGKVALNHVPSKEKYKILL